MKTICINHIARSKVYIPTKGVGDCRTCKPSIDNKDCLNYQPFKVKIIKVKRM